MTPKQYVKIVERFKYKPNWTFKAILNESRETVDVQLRARVDCAYNKGEKIDIAMRNLVTLEEIRCLSEESAKYMIVDKIREVEMHEMDEWLKYKGKRLIDPHPELRGKNGNYKNLVL